MAILGRANFLPGSGGGNSSEARAKKLADIYIKTHTDDGGDINDPEVYQYAIDTYLSPYADDLSIQQKIAGYQIKIKDLGQKNYEQEITLSSFKREVSNALFSKDERMARDPMTLARYTSDELDRALFGLNAAIEYLDSKNKKYDQLLNYRKELMTMANSQRSLVNDLSQGTANPDLGAYGYFIKTNPADGSFIGAALLPNSSAPSELTDGMKRVKNGVSINNSKIPVYLPTTKNEDGEDVAILGNNKWLGTGGSALELSEGEDFKDGNFNLSDSNKFPIKRFDLQKGQFGKKMSGLDQGGKPVYTFFYRGEDGGVRSIDQNSIEEFKKDPLMSKKLNNYVPSLGDDDVQSFGKVSPLTPDVVKGEKTYELKQQMSLANDNQQKAEEQYQKYNTGVIGALGRASEKIGSFFSDFSGRKNEPVSIENKTPISNSTPDIIASGGSFFKNKLNK